LTTGQKCGIVVESMEENKIKRGHNFKDLSGQIFGRLTAIKIAGKNKDGRILYE
jgi:hypothetical protein